MPKTEQTGKVVGSAAGSLLASKRALAAEQLLQRVIADPTSTDQDREDAALLVGVLASARSLAASSLTQRPDRSK